MKKYMIRCDMEGVSGIVSYNQAEPGNEEYGYGRKMFMSDLLALVEGLNQGGADEIVIYDEHYYGRNIEVEKLPANTMAICGKPPYRKGWPGGLDNSYEGLILLGMHSKYGTERGLLHHSYELDIKNIQINGVSVGEIGMEAAIAGDLKIPLLLVCGDSAAINEAKELVEGVDGVIVKKSLDTVGGLCYSSELTAEWIRNAARVTAEKSKDIKPLYFKGGISLKISLNEGKYLNYINKYFKNMLAEEDTLFFEGECVNDTWAEYLAFKLEVSKKIKPEEQQNDG